MPIAKMIWQMVAKEKSLNGVHGRSGEVADGRYIGASKFEEPEFR